MGNRLLKNQKGSSLLEITLSIGLISFGVMGGMLMMQNATVVSTQNDSIVVATQLANEKMENIIADKALNEDDYEYVVQDNYPEESLDYGEANGIFTRTTTVTEVDATDLSTPDEGSGTKKVDVTVEWQTPAGTKSVVVSTLLTDYE